MKKFLIINGYLAAALLFVKAKDIVYAAEQAQVIYDFMEMSEDVPVYEEPNSESKTDVIIPEGENVLILSQTAEGWYQILYHGEIAYINGNHENMTEMQISEDVVEEMEETRAAQELAQEETQEIMSEEADEAAEDVVSTGYAHDSAISEQNQKNITITKILLSVVVAIVALSGAGYWYMNRKEKLEQIKKREQTDLYIQDLDQEK